MQKITQLEQLDLNGSYTYADYLTWQFDEMLELIKGKIFMCPAPNVNHQKISIFVLNEEIQSYQLKAMFANDGYASPYLFPDFQIDLAEVFAE
jgi:hypothetical protein